ncbi:hypothetical protein [Erythrobacter donghaensis]|jgi:hypothetical protein|uniref:hypothetical protein n=1 Tax=Erythrobacter donghaensis TaxID=267135 RepID=UPI0009398CE2|nr:hypothetical protein [Erythrobacter donghaensis]
MFTSLVVALLAAQAAPESPAPAAPGANAIVTLDALPLEQAAAARCAVAFATVSRWQKAGDARGSEYPDIAASGGREFFVRVMAKLMEDTGLGREDIIALSTRAADDNEGEGGAERVRAIMPACTLMKTAAGL